MSDEQPLTYLTGDESGSVFISCEHPGCMVPGPCYSRLCILEIELPYKATPAQAQEVYDNHVRTHDGQG